MKKVIANAERGRIELTPQKVWFSEAVFIAAMNVTSYPHVLISCSDIFTLKIMLGSQEFLNGVRLTEFEAYVCFYW